MTPGTQANAWIEKHQHGFPHDQQSVGYLCPICRVQDSLPPITDPAGLLEQLWLDMVDVITRPTECPRCENVDESALPLFPPSDASQNS